MENRRCEPVLAELFLPWMQYYKPNHPTIVLPWNRTISLHALKEIGDGKMHNAKNGIFFSKKMAII